MASQLRERLVARIRSEGPITFADYMTAALYDPDDGFFSRAPVGPAGDFVTSPHVSPVFAACLARQAVDTWEQLGKPPSFTLIDLGAGDGLLGAQVRDSLEHHALASALRVVAVEQGARQRAAIAERGLAAVADLAAVAAPVDGLVVANELFDNLPFHLLRSRDGSLREVMVAERDGELIEREGEPTVTPPVAPQDGEPRVAPPDGEPVAPHGPPPTEFPFAPGAAAIVESIARVLRRGVALIVDYGFARGEAPEPIRGYRGHRLVTDLLADPGSTDITGPVDFGSLARAARRAGLVPYGPTDQRAALHALGYRSILDELRARQAGQETAGQWRHAVASFGARGDAATLVDPGGLGSLKVLGLATHGLRPPLALRSGF